jgi:5'-nucleotidase|tara:strand:+ start:186 stop:1115 length:930 start_codon:yes stop_codon:yes gene_type:complete
VLKPALFLTNDDGVDATGLRVLITALHQRGFPLVVIAPESEQSASGMKLTLSRELSFKSRDDLVKQLQSDDSVPMKIFSLSGSPCDCVIVGLDGGLDTWAPEIKPVMCISGINHGPNLAVDVLHSGTVSAARESCLYGMPALSVSLATYEHINFLDMIEGAIQVIESCVDILPKVPVNLLRGKGVSQMPDISGSIDSIRQHFADANIFLNLNAPNEWNGKFTTTSLGSRWYHNAIEMSESENGGVLYRVGAANIEDENIEGSDCNAVNSCQLSITPLSAWPTNHPLGLPTDLLQAATQSGDTGFPSWLE